MIGLKKIGISFIFTVNIVFSTVDFVIFSFDRPMQLYALLESTEKYITGLNETHVIYRVSDQRYKKAYERVIRHFDRVTFKLQRNQREFKSLTIKAIKSSSAPYLMFGVDDIIVKDYIDLFQCSKLLENSSYYGFYLRLGLNITSSFPNRPQLKRPKFKQIRNDIYAWSLGTNIDYWNYPNTVDMTIYRKKNVLEELNLIHFEQPNQLEDRWGFKIGHSSIGLCYKFSKIFNIPMNRVQNIYCNPNMNLFTANQLLDFFNEDKKIDISHFHKINNKCPHWECIPLFTSR